MRILIAAQQDQFTPAVTPALMCRSKAESHSFTAESVERADHRITMLLERAKRNGRRYTNPVPTKIGGVSVMFKVGPRFFLDAKARSPRGPLGPFHTDPNIYATPPKSGLRITWMGHATSIVEIDGARILIDPVWDE